MTNEFRASFGLVQDHERVIGMRVRFEYTLHAERRVQAVYVSSRGVEDPEYGLEFLFTNVPAVFGRAMEYSQALTRTTNIDQLILADELYAHIRKIPYQCRLPQVHRLMEEIEASKSEELKK